MIKYGVFFEPDSTIIDSWLKGEVDNNLGLYNSKKEAIESIHKYIDKVTESYESSDNCNVFGCTIPRFMILEREIESK